MVIQNIDIIVVSNIVTISLVRDEIITSLANLLDISKSVISIKGKTREGYESLVDGEVSAAFATVLGAIK